MPVHIALLRAVNVSGRSLPMAALRETLTELKLGDPRTLLQSGNAVFTSPKAPRALEALLAKAIAARFDLATDVFVRSLPEWLAAMGANPFPREAKDDPAHLLLMPLASSPTSAHVAALRKAIRGDERVEVDGRHAYLVYPSGIGSSKLTVQVIESRLETRGTARNWNTTGKLAALAAAS